MPVSSLVPGWHLGIFRRWTPPPTGILHYALYPSPTTIVETQQSASKCPKIPIGPKACLWSIHSYPIVPCQLLSMDATLNLVRSTQVFLRALYSDPRSFFCTLTIYQRTLSAKLSCTQMMPHCLTPQDVDQSRRINYLSSFKIEKWKQETDWFPCEFNTRKRFCLSSSGAPPGVNQAWPQTKVRQRWTGVSRLSRKNRGKKKFEDDKRWRKEGKRDA